MITGCGRRAAALLLVVFASPGGVLGSEPSSIPEARPVSLAEALATADVAPEIVAARAGIAAAEAEVRVARAPADLEVALSTNTVNAREVASVTVPLPWPARGPRVEAANAGVATAGRTREDALATTRQELRSAWFSLAAAEDRAAATADREARARRNTEAVAALFSEGRVARLEQVRSDAEAAQALADRLATEESRRTAAAALATLMGLPAGQTIATDATRPAPEPEPPLEATVARARDAAPEVQVQAAAAEAAAARFRLARRLRAPALGVNVGAEWNDPTQADEGTNAFAGVNLAIPVAGSASMAVAAAERDRESALLEQARRSAAVAAESAWGSTRAARLKYEAIDREVLPAARQAADLTRLAYREGRVDLFRLLDAERLLSETAIARADAYEAWGAAHADLLRLTSEDAP